LTNTIPDVLARIVAKKRQDLACLAAERPELERRAEEMRSRHRDFRKALTGRVPAIIAEVKKASPSRGLLSWNFDPVGLARQYEAGGAAAVSVLTDQPFFHGSLADLEAARATISLPVLRKDFTIDAVHVVEAAAHGADAVLLIAAILDEKQIREFRELAAGFGMAALVEIHDEYDMDRAIAGGADLIGVNNRDLMTFEVTLETSLRLAERLPSGVLKVSESGIDSAADIELLRRAGYTAFLVGEHLMKAPDPAGAIRALTTTASW
jgi:indole-3-glycerol phosphate synthase